jgi:hypothetical protein
MIYLPNYLPNLYLPKYLFTEFIYFRIGRSHFLNVPSARRPGDRGKRSPIRRRREGNARRDFDGFDKSVDRSPGHVTWPTLTIYERIFAESRHPW